MPRLPSALLRKAGAISPHLATLLLACRDLPLARSELRWLREHVAQTQQPPRAQASALARVCARRARGEPLQYILGSQPFGPLDILCQPGVLIPRPETEAYTARLARILQLRFPHPAPAQPAATDSLGLAVLDLCCGTGCIGLGLLAALRGRVAPLHVQGVDVSPRAIRLARRNAVHNRLAGQHGQVTETQQRAGHTVRFVRADVFDDAAIAALAAERRWDVLVANPPYICPRLWAGATTGGLGPSVRRFEPALALVPGPGLPRPPDVLQRDVFYVRLADLICRLRPAVALLEVGDMDQAQAVVQIATWAGLLATYTYELWLDAPEGVVPLTAHHPAAAPTNGNVSAVVFFRASSSNTSPIGRTSDDETST